MNLKSLLIGSAAALAVVSGAQAADAVVAAEPEPMEYVRVCDAYGTGYFYIPGTETCLKIGGQFRYEKRWSQGASGPSSYSNWSRGRIEVTAKNDSEFGTVSSWIRMQGAHAENLGPSVGYNYSFGIGGLEFAYHDSQFAAFGGYGGRTDWGGDYIDWTYGTRQRISYSMSMDSFSAVVSLEHDAVAGALSGSKYMPDVVLGASASFGDWSVTGVGAYDESDDSFAVAKFIRGDMGMFGITMAGFYSNSATNSYINYDGWSVLLGASVKATDSISLAGDVQFWDNESWRVIGDVSWAVASGFSVLVAGSIDDAENKSATIRFQRSF